MKFVYFALANGIYIAHIIRSNYCRREAQYVLAEGATTPETLRQKDCNNFKIWREVHKDKKGTHRRGWLYIQYDRSSQVPMTDGA